MRVVFYTEGRCFPCFFAKPQGKAAMKGLQDQRGVIVQIFKFWGVRKGGVFVYIGLPYKQKNMVFI